MGPKIASIQTKEEALEDATFTCYGPISYGACRAPWPSKVSTFAAYRTSSGNSASIRNLSRKVPHPDIPSALGTELGLVEEHNNNAVQRVDLFLGQIVQWRQDYRRAHRIAFRPRQL